MDVIFKEYVRVVWQKKLYFLLVVSGLSSATILDLSVPLFYKAIANRLAQPFSDQILSELLNSLSMIALFYVGIWLSWRVLELGIIPLEGGGLNLLEKRCFEVLKKQKYGFFESSFSGSLIKQANRFSRSFETIMDWFLFQFLQNLIAVSISFVLFYRQQPEFAFYFLLWVFTFISWNLVFSTWKLKFDKRVAEWDSKLGGVYSDAISNIFLVKSFALEQREQSKVDQTADQIYQKKKVAWILMFVSFAIQGIMTFGIELLLFYLMIQKWRNGNFEVGEFVLFQSILLMLIQRLWEFGRNFRTFFTALADAAEMAEVFRQLDVEQDSESAQSHHVIKGEIEFRNVCFTYTTPGKDNLFENFSLSIKPGEKIALVGQSGSGKTTLTKLLFRFCDPQYGGIFFDGKNTQNFTLASLRRQISLVPQQPELFHRSVRENIILDQEIPTSQLIDTARRARSLDFINNLPDGFDTLVGERGVKLSGGEKQRIAIARALLENAPIVVLDEATSALDSITEQQIQIAIFELLQNKTAIVIAHRLSTILRMDRIVVLEQGKIIEEGCHQELLQMHGRYYEMWHHQSGDFLDLQ